MKIKYKRIDEMLRNIKIKIVLVFVVIGLIAIGIIGYINYTNLQVLISDFQSYEGNYNVLIQNYQNQMKFITLCGGLAFGAICIVVRNSYSTKDYCSNK